MRSQIFAKSLPMPIVIGAIKRLEIMQSDKSLKNNLWYITKKNSSPVSEIMVLILEKLKAVLHLFFYLVELVKQQTLQLI